jgi:hypothetical protein
MQTFIFTGSPSLAICTGYKRTLRGPVAVLLCLLAMACSSNSSGDPEDSAVSVSDVAANDGVDAADDGAIDDVVELSPAHIEALERLRLAALRGSCRSFNTQKNLVRSYYWKYRGIRLALKTLRDECALEVSPVSCSSDSQCSSTSRTEEECVFASGSCDGNIYSICTPDGTFHTKCEELGMVCESDGCVDPNAEECPPGFGSGTAGAGCRDGRPTYCSDSRGLVSGDDCAAEELRCGSSEYEVTCIGQGARCDSIGLESNIVVEHPLVTDYRTVLACAGNDATACIGYREHNMACSEIHPDFTCQSFEGVPFCGLASECYGPEPPFPRCDGGRLRLCAAGLALSVDAEMLDLPSRFDDECFFER